MALSCSDFKEDLSPFVDGELDQHRHTAIASHLTDCSSCKIEHDSYRSLTRILQSSASQSKESAPDIWAALEAKLPGVCECIQEDLSAYLDGELIAPAREGISTHLEQCSVCLSKFNELSKVNTLLSKGLELPAEFEVDIWSKVKSRLNEDCILIKSELSAFIDKEVAILRHREITAHLLDCADCQSEFNGLAQAGESLRTHYQPVFPENFDLLPDIMSKMKVVPLESKSKTRPAVAQRRLYAVAAAAILGVLASIGMFISFHSTAPAVTPVTAEAYLIDSSLGEPGDNAEAVVYDH
jgi:anti-sigma factor RsiW